MSADRFVLVIAPTARRQLAETLPEPVAFAAYEFITGPLWAEPYRVGKPLRAPLEGQYSARRGTYRVIYRVTDRVQQVIVSGVFARSDAYRPR